MRHLNPDRWYRLGRGRQWSFDGSAQDLRDALLHVAQQHDRRLQLLLPLKISGRPFRSSFEVVVWDALLSAEHWQYFVRDEGVTDAFVPETKRAGYWPSMFAVNGLLVVHHPEPGTNRDRGSIGVVHHVGNDAGEDRHHAEYDALFGAVKRRLQRTLR